TRMSPAKLSWAPPPGRSNANARNHADDESHRRIAAHASVRRTMLAVADLLSIWTVALFAIGIRFPRPANGYTADERAAIGSHLGFLLLYSGLVVLIANTQQ